MANKKDVDYTPAQQRDPVVEDKHRSGVEEARDLADDTGDEEVQDEDNEDIDEEEETDEEGGF